MAYDKKKIFEQAKKAIKANNLFFVEDVVAYIPISKKTFYEWWPTDSDECNTLKEHLEENKIIAKVGIRQKLAQGEKAAELLALYRLICTPEEHRLLNQQYVENKTTLDITKPLTPEEIAKARKDFENEL